MTTKANKFTKATRQQKKLRLFLRGASGSGKTYSALLLAQGVSNGGKIALIDTEKLSSTHYSDLVDFDVIDFNSVYSSHKPKHYIELIDEAESAGYDVLIIDSFSHAWIGHGGIIDINEFLAKTRYNGNTFRAWSETTPNYYNPLVEKVILQNNMHIIATGRVKTEYEVGKDDSGKVEIKKLGSKTMQREGLEYEFDTILDLAHGEEGLARPDKDRTRVFPHEGEIINEDTGKRFYLYLNN